MKCFHITCRFEVKVHHQNWSTSSQFASATPTECLPACTAKFMTMQTCSYRTQNLRFFLILSQIWGVPSEKYVIMKHNLLKKFLIYFNKFYVRRPFSCNNLVTFYKFVVLLVMHNNTTICFFTLRSFLCTKYFGQCVSWYSCALSVGLKFVPSC
jgi:hypothetical protein